MLVRNVNSDKSKADADKPERTKSHSIKDSVRKASHQVKIDLEELLST